MTDAILDLLSLMVIGVPFEVAMMHVDDGTAEWFLDAWRKASQGLVS